MQKSNDKKEGISLIVLVITIIVMIVLATAIIISLNNSGIIANANKAVSKTRLKEIQTAASLISSDYILSTDTNVKSKTIRDYIIEKLQTDYKVTVGELAGLSISVKGEIKVKEGTLTTATGTTNIEFESTNRDTLADYRIYGNSTQGTIQTSKNPVPVNSLGENQKIVVRNNSKNLLPISDLLSYTKNGVTVTQNSDGSYTLNGTTTVATDIYLYNVNTWNYKLPSKTIYGYLYVISGTESKNTSKNFTFNENGTKQINALTLDTELMGSKNETGVECYFNAFRLTPSANVTFENYRIIPWLSVENATATAYEPYEHSTIIDLTGHEPLRKIGDVSDYLDYKNQCIVRKIGKVEFTGDEDWYYLVNRDTTDYVSIYLNNSYVPNSNVKNLDEPLLFTNFAYLKSDEYRYHYRTQVGIMGYPDSSAAFMITALASDFDSRQAWQDYVRLEYKAGRPVTYTIN